MSDNSFDQTDHPRASSGRFVAKDFHDAAGGMDALQPASRPDLDAGVNDLGAAGATQAELLELLRHPNPLARAEVLASADATPEMVARLSEPDQHISSRLAAAQSFHRGAAARASRDRDPVVRLLSRTGWDLPAADARRLDNDPQVAKVRAALTSA